MDRHKAQGARCPAPENRRLLPASPSDWSSPQLVTTPGVDCDSCRTVSHLLNHIDSGDLSSSCIEYETGLKFLLCTCVLISGLLGPAFPVTPEQNRSQSDFPLRTDLRTWPARVAPGQWIWIALTLSLDPGWHIYGNPKGPGPGLPTTLEAFSLPQGVRASLAVTIRRPDTKPCGKRFLPANSTRLAGSLHGETMNNTPLLSGRRCGVQH